MTETSTTVTVLGTGAIGSAVASALTTAGHPVRVWNRSPQGTHAATSAGAVAYPTAAEACDRSPLVLVTVTDYEAVDAVLAGLTPPREPATLAVLATGTPSDAERAAARATDLGYATLDVGVQTAPDDVGTPRATFLFGGDEAAFARHRDVFDALGAPRFVGRSPAAAAIWDLVLFGVWYDAQLGVLRALDAVEQHGIDPVAFAETAAVQLGHAADAATATAEELVRGEFPRGPADLREHLPVLEQLAELRAGGRLGDGGAADAAGAVRSAIDDGHGADGLTGLLRRG